jgi:hypothetical protein
MGEKLWHVLSSWTPVSNIYVANTGKVTIACLCGARYTKGYLAGSLVYNGSKIWSTSFLKNIGNCP